MQTSIKFTAEPPQGVKAGLKRTYGIITQDQLDVTNMPQWKALLYDVAFLHTTVQVCELLGRITPALLVRLPYIHRLTVLDVLKPII